MDAEHWKISIDTGGTFTDCLAYEPSGALKRIKVLSSGVLKGRIINSADKRTLSVKPFWNEQTDIFNSYELKIPNADFTTTVISSELKNGLITIGHDIYDHVDGYTFELTAFEEAPVLACRLATGTGLNSTFPPIDLRLGSTKGTNALLEMKGAKCALIVSKGFKDLLLIGTQQRKDLFALEIEKPAPLYHQVFEAFGRLDKDGNEIEPIDLNNLNGIVKSIIDSGINSVAVCLMNSFRNDAHEKAVYKLLKESRIEYISLSCVVNNEIGLLPRAETTLVNSYLLPVISNYLQRIVDKLDTANLQVMSSSGGLSNYSNFHPKDSLLSGPAGGVVGAGEVAKGSGVNKVLALDMGGTSTDVARYDDGVDYQFECTVGTTKILSPSVAIKTVAAGGGSICGFDGSRFTVGPESAGAYPGPACYGNDGPLTITDINLLLGRLNPDSFRIPVDIRYSKNELVKILPGIGSENKTKYYSVLEGFRAIANEKMAEAIRKISTANGYDPKEYALLSFGGAGGQHACAVAELLGMNSIIVPYDAGLLSAYGISKSAIEKFRSLQVLKPWNSIKEKVGNEIKSLFESAVDDLRSEGYHKNEIETSYVSLLLRFVGQDASLEISFQDNVDPILTFKNSYEKLYGHWVEGKEIELVSIKVAARVSSRSNEAKNENYARSIAPPVRRSKAYFNGQESESNTYIWEDIKVGSEIIAPALVTSENSTFILEPGWSAYIDENRNFQVHRKIENAPKTSQEPEAAKLELFTNRFMSIAEEMGELLKRTAFSVNIKERLDFSCGILDHVGDLIVNAPHIPVHLGSLGVCVRRVMEKIEISPGDILITNHPGYGGSHLPDITLIAPIFHEEKLIGYVANRAHHAEMGGKRPGSMPPDAQNLEEEGVVFLPQHIVKNGKANWENIEELLSRSPYPSRSVSENLADLRAGIASLKIGQDLIMEMCQKHGTDSVLLYMDRLKDYVHRRAVEAIGMLKNKKYQSIERLDDGSVLTVSIEAIDDHMTFDFTGTSPVHKGNLNANISIVTSAVLYVLRLMIKESIPLNEGIVKAVSIIAPVSLLNPDFNDDPRLCPAVVGGNTEVSQRLVDTLIKALGLSACSQGTMNNLLFGNGQFGYYETVCGGTGAGEGFNGCSGVHHHMTNTKITDAEILEHRYPAILREFSINEGTGGKGKWYGGNGITRIIQFTDQVELTMLTQHRKEAPFGMNGGESGTVGKQYVVKRSGEHIDLDGIDERNLEEGDTLVLHTPGGGGFGSE